MTASAAAIARAEARREVGDVVVELESAEVRLRQVARRGVPGNVALEEQHSMAARGQAAQQRAIGGGVAVAPGRRQRQPEEHQVQAPRRHAASASRRARQRVSAAARCNWRGAPVIGVLAPGCAAAPRRPIAAACSARQPAAGCRRRPRRRAPPAPRCRARGTCSMPSQASVMRQAPAPAASNSRVGGEKPVAAMLARLMFSTARGVDVEGVVRPRCRHGRAGRRWAGRAGRASPRRRAGSAAPAGARPGAAGTPRRAPRGPAAGCRGTPDRRRSAARAAPDGGCAGSSAL